ncbi:MAG: AraC family transcriptional regulator [Lachnospiraceae bacterium]|nr:AraC family transcriptional regulator [Lachnospiraceae bacterium]
MDLHQNYRPETAAPSAQNYGEFEPCKELRPYIRCFWEAADDPRLVTPDTCADILFLIDHAAGQVESWFCGVNDRPFFSQPEKRRQQVSLFAIRFYAWSAVFFADDSLRGTRNGFFNARQHFFTLCRKLPPKLLQAASMAERIRAAEECLIAVLCPGQGSPIVQNAVLTLLKSRGAFSIDSLAGAVFVSRRQLERLFREQLGLSPKRLASLVRYQYLWNEILSARDFCVQDAVNRYGYADQAHLLHDFKRFHSLSVVQARQHAVSNVAFLQENSPSFCYNKKKKQEREDIGQ